MSAIIDRQVACKSCNIPEIDQLSTWVNAVLSNRSDDIELTIRFVDIEEIQQLNNLYRQKDKPTNVLSFPFEAPEGVNINLLGDLVICADIVNAEAIEQHKLPVHHWAHMVIHGCLHLLGYDHITDADADEMESLEIKILATLNIANPYVI